MEAPSCDLQQQLHLSKTHFIDMKSIHSLAFAFNQAQREVLWVNVVANEGELNSDAADTSLSRSDCTLCSHTVCNEPVAWILTEHCPWCYLLLLHQLFLVLFILLSCHSCCFGWIWGGGLLFGVTSTSKTHSWQGVPNHALDQESHLELCDCLFFARDENNVALLTVPSALASYSCQIQW